MRYASRIGKELAPLMVCGFLAAACVREPQRPSTSSEGLIIPTLPPVIVISRPPTSTLEPTLTPTETLTPTLTAEPSQTPTVTLTPEPTYTPTPEPTVTYTPTSTPEPTPAPPTATRMPDRYTRTMTPLPVNAAQVIEKIITANREPGAQLGAELYRVTLESCGVPEGVLVCDQDTYSVDRIVFMSASRGQIVPYSSYRNFPQLDRRTIRP